MAQNEMKAKPALPERVRSMEGLDGMWEHGKPACVGIPERMALAIHEFGFFKRWFAARYAQPKDRSRSAAAASAVRLPTPGKRSAKPSP